MGFRGIFCILGLVAAISNAQAAEWSFEPSINATTRYDDNIRLSSSNEIDATELAIKPSAIFSRETERSSLAGKAEFAFRRFDEDGLDTNDSSFNLNARHSFSEFTTIGLDANWIKDTTLESELDETGILFDRTERRRFSLSPSINHRINERWTGRASLTSSKTRYEDINHSDYTTQSADSSLEWEYTPKTLLFAALGFTRQEYDDDTYKSENKQLTFGFDHEFSERTSLNAFIGGRKTETTTLQNSIACPPGAALLNDEDFLSLLTSYPFLINAPANFRCYNPDTNVLFGYFIQPFDATTDSSGSVINATLKHRLERGELSASVSRDVSPSASYGLIVNDRMSVNLLHKFTETVTGQLNISQLQTDGSDQTLAVIDQKYFNVNTRLTWQLDRDLSFSANYRYRKQEREGGLDSATSNAVSFALTYSWPKTAISR